MTEIQPSPRDPINNSQPATAATHKKSKSITDRVLDALSSFCQPRKGKLDRQYEKLDKNPEGKRTTDHQKVDTEARQILITDTGEDEWREEFDAMQRRASTGF